MWAERKKVKYILCDINSSQNETIFLTLTHSNEAEENEQSKDERNIKTDKSYFYFYGSFFFLMLWLLLGLNERRAK